MNIGHSGRAFFENVPRRRSTTITTATATATKQTSTGTTMTITLRGLSAVEKTEIMLVLERTGTKHRIHGCYNKAKVTNIVSQSSTQESSGYYEKK